MGSYTLKCKKCRFILPCRNVAVQELNLDAACCSSFEEIIVLIVDEAKLPDEWLRSSLDNGDWCKGRILCPKCCSKIGGFDFIKGLKCRCIQKKSLPEIHLNKCQVDIFFGQDLPSSITLCDPTQ